MTKKDLAEYRRARIKRLKDRVAALEQELESKVVDNDGAVDYLTSSADSLLCAAETLIEIRHGKTPEGSA